HARAVRRDGAGPGRRRGPCGGPQRDDGRSGRGHPRRPRPDRPRGRRHSRLHREVRVRLLRAVPRGRRVLRPFGRLVTGAREGGLWWGGTPGLRAVKDLRTQGNNQPTPPNLVLITRVGEIGRSDWRGGWSGGQSRRRGSRPTRRPRKPISPESVQEAAPAGTSTPKARA